VVVACCGMGGVWLGWAFGGRTLDQTLDRDEEDGPKKKSSCRFVYPCFSVESVKTLEFGWRCKRGERERERVCVCVCE
jgi:hypothetical protein